MNSCALHVKTWLPRAVSCSFPPSLLCSTGIDMSRHRPYRAHENRRRQTQWNLDSSGGEENHRDHRHNLVQLDKDESVTIRTGSSAELSAMDMITKKVVDHHGQVQALLTCSSSGIWSIHSADNVYAFTVRFDNPSFRNVITSKQPWDIAEWSAPARINILLELLHLVCVLQTQQFWVTI